MGAEGDTGNQVEREDENQYKGKFQALQEANNGEDHSEEDDSEEENDIDNGDTGKIYWFSEDNA